MGGAPPTKRESNAERNARLLSAKRSGADAKSLALDSVMLRNARRRSSLFGGPESGAAAAPGMGGGQTRLGVGY